MLGRWSDELHHIVHRVCATTPTSKHFSQENAANWAGYVTTGGSYNEVYASWTVPCVGGSVKNSDSATWVGLGGDPSDGGGNLVQAGTEQGYSSTEQPYYDTWIEDYPYNGAQVINWNTYCGDLMDVQASSNYDCANQVFYEVADDSTGYYYGKCVAWPLANGSTADWIEERPTYYLADFSSVTFTSSEVIRYGGSSWIYLGNEPHNSVVMWTSVSNGQGQGNKLAYPGSISNSTNFTVYYNSHSH